MLYLYEFCKGTLCEQEDNLVIVSKIQHLREQPTIKFELDGLECDYPAVPVPALDPHFRNLPLPHAEKRAAMCREIQL